MKATEKDLRIYLKELLDTVSRGEEVIITLRGKPHAKLIPIESEQKRKILRNSLFGIWKDHDAVKNVKQYVRKIREGRFQ